MKWPVPVAVAFAFACGWRTASASPEPKAERARETSWERLTADVFDPRWRLPDVRTVPGAKRQPVDLRRRARDLAEMRFSDPPGAEPEPRARSFGDLLAAVLAYGEDRAGRDAFLAWVREQRRDIWDSCGAELEQLGRDEFLRSTSWNPDEDHRADGIFVGEAFRADCEGTLPWTAIDGDPLAQQAMALFRADLDSIKEAESDYAAYSGNTGASYEFIHAVSKSYVRAKDPAGRPASAYRVAFRCDLPFPYSHYDCDLRVVNRVGDDELMTAHVYSPSRDFDWMAGDDLFVPLLDADKRFVGMLCAKAFGFDLDGVPDGESNVREAMRSSLGNLKRRAEALYADRKSPRTTKGSLPDVSLRGVE